MKYQINGEEVEIDGIHIQQSKADLSKRVTFKLNGKDFEFDVNMIKDHEGMVHSQGKKKVTAFVGRSHVIAEGLDFFIEKQIVNKMKKAKDYAQGMLSPMPCRIFKLLAKVGDSVIQGQTLVILEAMKMEHTIKASCDGIIKSVAFKEGDLIEGGVELLELVPHQNKEGGWLWGKSEL